MKFGHEIYDAVGDAGGAKDVFLGSRQWTSENVECSTPWYLRDAIAMFQGEVLPPMPMHTHQGFHTLL
ncbi:hypothetical protein FR483_n184R [Paramecium bursaria Chlorella virus FR483]|uniref:Uncharacterized protein n184R n=1 Tax=Paramecium bursaria Chlorella virus FR483 TaxID=399781 RepID=A7J6N8_PBCVF|nr:hypothetical protein FR483_n184R [Paramecium bursaria Chlorella virus FR483]ABT15469.1 hypothetical protein FR483_n184R [Paramecium bursaria Chlorella virus FR483]